MSRPRAKGAGKARAKDSILEFFFVKGDPRRPRQELVTREDLFRALEWYDRRARAPRTVWRRLIRAARRMPSWNPFGWLDLQREKLDREEHDG